MAAIAAGPPQPADGPLSSAARMLARVQAAVSVVIGAVGVVSVLALALLGVGLANAGGSAVAAVRATRVVLKTADIGGVTVLTNAQGLTLYRFALDTPTTSKCTGSCAEYWPPVYGSPEAGPGVTGLLGTIRRPDGAVQATYDGYPLYTYVGDSAGQASGNNLDLNGGLWYEVRVSGLGAPHLTRTLANPIACRVGSRLGRVGLAAVLAAGLARAAAILLGLLEQVDLAPQQHVLQLLGLQVELDLPLAGRLARVALIQAGPDDHARRGQAHRPLPAEAHHRFLGNLAF
jgi:predicted lipoprotein with Yx(FWY)xxD motif